MQFFNLDFGMEICQLSIQIPESGFLSQTTSSDKSTMIDVWFLDSSLELSRYTSWHRAPRRTELLSSFPLLMDTQTVSERYHCPSGNITTFEIACVGEQFDCNIDFWQKKSSSLEGTSMSSLLTYVYITNLNPQELHYYNTTH